MKQYHFDNSGVCHSPSVFTVFKTENIEGKISLAYDRKRKWFGNSRFIVGNTRQQTDLKVRLICLSHKTLTETVIFQTQNLLEWIEFQNESKNFPDELAVLKTVISQIEKNQFKTIEDFQKFLDELAKTLYKSETTRTKQCSKPHVVRKVSDNTLHLVRCCEVPNDTTDFDIVWEKYENGQWIPDKKICSPDYNFHVPDCLEKTKIEASLQTAIHPVKKKIDLNNYPGAKGGSGVIQKLINQVPTGIEIIVEGCLGSGVFIRTIQPAKQNVGIDINNDVLLKFKEEFNHTYIQLIEYDIEKWLRSLKGKDLDKPTTFIYLDPPYPKESRKNQRDLYDYEMPTLRHASLLEAILQLKCKIMISTRANELYAEKLKDWRLVEFTTSDRSGTKVTEQLYCNYPAPKELHDTRFVGNNFRERERIKRKAKRNVDKFKKLPPLERQAIIELMKKENLV